MDEAYIGTIVLWSGIRIPQNWHVCDGSLLPIQQYAALYSLIGTTYGGDGRTNFALPDLRGNVPVGTGTALDGTQIQLAAKGGARTVELNASQIPASLPLSVSFDVGTTATSPMVNPAANQTVYLSAVSAKTGPSAVTFQGLYTNTAPTGNKATLGGGTVSRSGGGQQTVPTQAPYLGLNFIIALNGLYPSFD
ncbi:MAG: tail fiber protein [Pseudogulbenkiania sp.]|nr:tail fiber protein [Pseudogulbenkiania sp.]